MKKVSIKSFLIALFAVTVIALGLYLQPSKTVDFSGTITGIAVEGDSVRFTINNSGMATYTVYADKGTKVYYHRKEDLSISLSEIAVGDIVQGDFNRIINKKTAKYIVVEYHQ